MSGTIMYISGGQWDGVPGTDRFLAEALSNRANVIWVDQPISVARNAEVRRHAIGSLRGVTERVTNSVERLRLPALPGFSRPLIRRSTEVIASSSIQSTATRVTDRIAAVINASPLVQFPRGLSAPRLLHVTDDWLASSELMGLSAAHVERVLRANIAAADLVTAVSPGLAQKISAFSGRTVEFLPNGCRAPALAEAVGARQPVAVLVGQLNERLDFDTLSELGRSGIPVMVLGPRTERAPSARKRLDEFLSWPTVQWHGEVSRLELAKVLGTATVGLTPYTTSEFNRSSFPLKTLEYLAFGLPVVATDLPATRWIGSEFVNIATSSRDFVELVRSNLATHLTGHQRRLVQTTVQEHTWDVRAERLLSLLAQQPTTEPVSHQAPRHIGST